MPSVISIIEGKVEVAAADILKWLSAGGKIVTKIEGMEPQVAAALGVVFSAVNTAVANVGSAAAAPANIQLDQAALASIKAVWPDIQAFFTSLGIKL
jgi:hypothetical protein